MKLRYYADRLNFGDTINSSLWNDVLPCLNRAKAGGQFYGIGSILFWETFFNSDSIDEKHVVFGTGFRKDYEKGKEFDVDYLFLRGHLSARECEVDESRVLADAAYSLLLSDTWSSLSRADKSHDITVVPHMSSANRTFWKIVAIRSKVNVVFPNDQRGAGFVLSEISRSKLVLAEAMHGAIFADICRVPWMKLGKISSQGDTEEFNMFKWSDWLSGIEIVPEELEVIQVGGSDQNGMGGGGGSSKLTRFKSLFFTAMELSRKISGIRAISDSGYLSTDATIKRIKAGVSDARAEFERKYS